MSGPISEPWDAARRREWIASGPHDGSPPYSLGVVGIGPVLWYHSKFEAQRDAERLNHFEEYVSRCSISHSSATSSPDLPPDDSLSMPRENLTAETI